MLLLTQNQHFNYLHNFGFTTAQIQLKRRILCSAAHENNPRDSVFGRLAVLHPQLNKYPLSAGGESI